MSDLKITSVDIWKCSFPLKHTLKISLGSVSFANETLLRVNTNSDIVGWGEASSFPFILGDTQETNFESAKYLAKLLIGENPIQIEPLMRKIERNIIHESSVRCAYDSAFYDILGKVANLPVYKILGGIKKEIPSDLAILMMNSLDEVRARTNELLSLNTNQIKVKVGYGKKKDYEIIKTIRNIVGMDLPIRIDANQAWDFPTAVQTLRSLEEFNLEFCEQPVARWDIENMKLLRSKTSIPICADESCFDSYDAFKLISNSACDYINIKLMKAGGLHHALKINSIAESAGIKCMVGCMCESRLGMATTVHFATARPNIAFYDLDSPSELQVDPIIGGWQYLPKRGATILVGDEPGIGVEADPDFLKKQEHITID